MSTFFSRLIAFLYFKGFSPQQLISGADRVDELRNEIRRVIGMHCKIFEEIIGPSWPPEIILHRGDHHEWKFMNDGRSRWVVCVCSTDKKEALFDSRSPKEIPYYYVVELHQELKMVCRGLYDISPSFVWSQLNPFREASFYKG